MQRHFENPPYPRNPILIVDDEEESLRSFRLSLKSAGMDNLILCQDSREVLEILRTRTVDLLLLDLVMPKLSGRELLPQLREEHPNISIIVITALDDLDTAVGCMSQGASDYMVKPVERARLLSGVSRAIEQSELEKENSLLKEHMLSRALETPSSFEEIITADKGMHSIFHYVEAIAQTKHPVLVTGETGVGKELIAQAIHSASQREGPFITVNVAGLDDNVFSDTLFGHRKGAFTGALDNREGLLQRASGGTLLLDEMGDLPLKSQVKLLRLIQEREYFPLGSDRPKQSSARIITATNRSIEELRDSPHFRRDLFFRLRGHHIHLPPLRKRPKDIPLLLDYFIEKASLELGKKTPSYPAELAVLLKSYPFPGNIRELEALVFDAVSKHKSHILSMESFKGAMAENAPKQSRGPDEEEDSSKQSRDPVGCSVIFGERLPSLKEVEKLLIEEALERSEGKQSLAARLLGISRQALNRRLRQEQKGERKVAGKD